jgi:hypothetical protein
LLLSILRAIVNHHLFFLGAGDNIMGSASGAMHIIISLINRCKVCAIVLDRASVFCYGWL